MCRILYLLNQSNAKSKIKHFLMQSDIKPTTKDGHGLASLNPVTNKWRIYKSPNPEPNQQQIIDMFSDYSLIIGHMRRINMPNTDAKFENTHPFYYRNQIFFHNGIFENSQLPVNRKWFKANILPELWSNIKGETDSEHVFYLLLSIIQKHSLKKNSSEELTNSVHTWIQLLHNKFNRYFANFIYANKDYSVVGRIERNATTEEKHNATLYMSSEKNKILFSTLPLVDKQQIVEWGVVYIIHNKSGEYNKIRIGK
jgi:predicted glutamine amidotransferase